VDRHATCHEADRILSGEGSVVRCDSLVVDESDLSFEEVVEQSYRRNGEVKISGPNVLRAEPFQVFLTRWTDAQNQRGAADDFFGGVKYLGSRRGIVQVGEAVFFRTVSLNKNSVSVADESFDTARG
jgi:hypothetical protein